MDQIKTTVGDFTVSTVDLLQGLGLMHQDMMTTYRRLVTERGRYETMVFNDDTEVRPDLFGRHDTEPEAKAWHEHACETLRKEAPSNK